MHPSVERARPAYARPSTTSLPADRAAHVPLVPPREDDISTVPVTGSWSRYMDVILILFGAVLAREPGRCAVGRMVAVVVSRGSVGPSICRRSGAERARREGSDADGWR